MQFLDEHLLEEMVQSILEHCRGRMLNTLKPLLPILGVASLHAGHDVTAADVPQRQSSQSDIQTPNGATHQAYSWV